jgi:hypothetical protein
MLHCMLHNYVYRHTHTHTHTHSKYVIIVAFPLQQWFRERACVILSYGLSGSTISSTFYHKQHDF